MWAPWASARAFSSWTLPEPNSVAGGDGAEGRDLGGRNLQIERAGEPDRFVKPLRSRPRRRGVAAGGVDDQGALDLLAMIDAVAALAGGGRRAQASSSGEGSYSCTGAEGITVEMACL